MWSSRRPVGTIVATATPAAGHARPAAAVDIAFVDVNLGDRGCDLAEGEHADLLPLGKQILDFL